MVDATHAIKNDPHYVKAYLRRAAELYSLGGADNLVLQALSFAFSHAAGTHYALSVNLCVS